MKYFSLPLLWALAIAIVSLMPAPRIPEVEIDYADKVVHVFVYMVLTILLIWASHKKNEKKTIPYTTLFVILASSSVYGLIMEILQFTITTGRNFEIPDIMANIVGCLFGVFLYKSIKSLSIWMN